MRQNVGPRLAVQRSHRSGQTSGDSGARGARMPEVGRGVLTRRVEWARCHCRQNEHEEYVKRRSRRNGRSPRRSKKVELSNGDVKTKNNDDDDDNEEVLVVPRSRMPRVRARPFLSHNSLCTPVSNNDTARAYLMHCDKEFKESAEERFHPDPSLMMGEREGERE